ncbi:MAG: LTA synthase family protein, partial [Halanaerobiales bacterium]
MNIFHGYTKNQKYYALIFLLGFIIKYNFFLERLFNIPSITGLIFKNIILLIFFFAFVLPLVKNKKGRDFLFLFIFIFTIFFLSNIWYNRYFGNYLSLSDMMMGRGFRPFKVLFRQLLKMVDFVFIIDLLILAFYRFKEKRTIAIKRIFANQKLKSQLFVIGIIIVLLISQI